MDGQGVEMGEPEVKVEGRRHTVIYLQHEIFPIVRAVGKVYGLLLTMGL